MGAELQAFGAMPLRSKRSPAEGEFLFEIDEEPSEECLTALGGVPLFVREFPSPPPSRCSAIRPT